MVRPRLELPQQLANRVLLVKRVLRRVTDSAVLVQMASPRLVVRATVPTIVKIVHRANLKRRAVLPVFVVCVSKEPTLLLMHPVHPVPIVLLVRLLLRLVVLQQQELLVPLHVCHVWLGKRVVPLAIDNVKRVQLAKPV